jgi:hypothetical protein
MRPVSIICSLLVLVHIVNAQIPRTTAGVFEYSGEFAADNMPQVMERATSFFNQPFLVHWDSVAQERQVQHIRVIGSGHILVKAKHHEISTPSEVPVFLQMVIEVKNGRYRYTINHFVVNEKDGSIPYRLENKPDSVKAIVYDQLLQKTHKRITFVIGWLRKYMKDED